MATLSELQAEYNLAVSETTSGYLFNLSYVTSKVRYHTAKVFEIILSPTYVPDATELNNVFEYLDSCITHIKQMNGNNIGSIITRFNNLGNDRIALLLPTLLNALPDYIGRGLNYSFFNVLNSNTVSGLSSKYFLLMSTANVRGLSADFWNATNLSDISGLNYIFLSNVNNSAVIPRLSGAFVNAISADVLRQFPSSFFNGLNLTTVGQLALVNMTTVPPATWTVLTTDFYNALAPTAVTNIIGYDVLNCLSDIKIANLSIGFLNAINVGTVDIMIRNNWIGHIRPNGSIASKIPKNKWLGLDGTKYASLLASAAAGDIVELMSISFSLVRADALNVLSVNAVGGLTITFINSLSITQCNQLNTAFCNALSRTVIASLNANFFNNLSNDVIHNLTPTHFSAMSTAVISQLNANFFRQLTSTQVSAFPTTVINVLTQDQISNLSVEAVSGFTSAQFNLLTTTQIAGFGSKIIGISASAISGLSTDACTRLVNYLNNFPAATVQSLTPSFFNALTTAVIGRLNANFFNNISNALWAELSAYFFNSLTQTQISSYITANNQHIFWPLSQMNWQVVSQLSADFFNKLSGSQMFWINSPFLNCVNTTVLASVNQSVRAGILVENFDTLSADRQAIIYTADYYNNLSPEVVSRVTYSHIVAMNVTTIARLSASFLNALRTTVIAQFTLDFFNNLPVAVIGRLNANFVNNISNALIRVIGADWTAGARFLNALSQDASSAVGNVVAQLDPVRFIGSLNDWPIKPAVWAELSAGFFNAMSPTTVANYMGYGALNCIRDATIPLLSVAFLNAINAGSVDLMISNNWNGYVRPNRSFALNIPTNKWLSLDGTKYKGLIIGLTAANINAYSAADFAGIRADALNALANPAVGSFLPSESGRQIIQAISPNALSTILANISTSSLEGGVAAFLNALSSVQASGGTANGANYAQIPSAILNKIALSTNGRVTIPNLSATFFSNLAGSPQGRGTIAHLNAEFFSAMTTAQKNNVGANFLEGLVTGTAFDGAINFLRGITADYFNNWAASHQGEIANLSYLFLSQINTSIISGLNANFLDNIQAAVVTQLSTSSTLWAQAFGSVTSVKMSGSGIALSGTGGVKLGTEVTITVSLTKALNFANPNLSTLTLSNNATATYVSGNNSTELKYKYTVLSGDLASGLTVRGISLGGTVVVSGKAINLGDISTKTIGIVIVDGVVPTISITTSNASLSTSTTKIISFILSETSSNFTLNNLSVTGGTLGAFLGLGTSYTAIFTPNLNSTTSAQISIKTSFTDAAGNLNTTPSPLSIAVDTLAPNASNHIWIPAAQDGISASEALDGVNVIVSLAGTNAVAGDDVRVIFTTVENTDVRWGRGLTQDEINAGYALLKISPYTYATNPNFRVQIIDVAGNASAVGGGVLSGVDGLDTTWFNNLASDKVAQLTSGLLNVMANTPDMVSALNVQFFNALNLVNISQANMARISDAFLMQIPPALFSPAVGRPSDVLSSNFIQALAQRIIHDPTGMALTAMQLQGFSSANLTVFLNNFKSSGIAMPLNLLDAFSTEQVATWDTAMLIQFVAEANRDKLSDAFIVALANKTFGGSTVTVCIPTTWLQKLTEYQINLFLNAGMQVLNTAQKNTVISVGILNSLSTEQISNLRDNMFRDFMPLGHLRSDELNQSVISAMTPLQISKLNLAAVTELGLNIKNNTHAYNFTKVQIQALVGNDNAIIDTQLNKFFEGYYSYDPDTGITYVDATISYEMLNKLSRIQARQLSFLLLDSCLPDLSSTSFDNTDFLIGLGEKSYTSNSLVLSDDNYHALTGSKLEAFLSGFGSHLITGKVLTKLTASQIASLSKSVILQLDAASLSVVQLNAVLTTMVPNLDVSWLNKIPTLTIAGLSLNFVTGLGLTKLTNLSSEWIKSLSPNVVKKLDASWISAIIKAKGVISTVFTAEQVAQFSVVQLHVLFSASVSYKTGDGVFQDISSVVNNLTKDQVSGISFYLLSGAVQNADVIARLIQGRTNLNNDVLAQIQKYEDNAELYEFSRKNPIAFGVAHPLTDTIDLLNNIGAAIRETRRLLDIAPSDDWHLLSADTMNRLSTAVMRDYEYADSLWAAGQSSEHPSVDAAVNTHFNNLNKSTIQGLSDLLLQSIDLSSFTSANVPLLTDHQVLVFLSRFHVGSVGPESTALITQLSSSVLGLLSAEQTINLPIDIFSDTSANTWGVYINLSNLNNYPDRFLFGLGEREASTQDHVLTEAVVHSLDSGKLLALIGYWTNGITKLSVSNYVMRLLSTTQLNNLPDVVYKNLERSFTDDILDIIPPSKISLLPASYFVYPRRETIAGVLWKTWMGDRLWPSDDQLANMTLEQANSLLSIWTQYELTPSTSWSQFFSAVASLVSPWTLVSNVIHHVATQAIIDNKLPSNNILEETLAGLPYSVRQQLNVVAGSDGLFGFQYMDLAERDFNFIGHLPNALIAMLNSVVINRIAVNDYAVYNEESDESLVFSRQAFSALTSTQLTQYLQKWRNSVGELEALPIDLLNNLSSPQVGVIGADVIALSLTKDNIPLLNRDFAAGLTASQLAVLDREEIQSFTIRQIMFISPASIAGLGNKLQDFSQDQYDRLLPDQLAAISNANLMRNPADYVYLNKDTFCGLSFAQLLAIPADSFAKVDADTLKYLTKAQVESLSYQQIWALSNTQLSNLLSRSLRGTIPDLSAFINLGLSTDQVSGLDASVVNSTISHLERSALVAVLASDLQKIKPSVFAELTLEQLAYLTQEQVFSLRLGQYEALTAEKQAVIVNNGLGPVVLFSAQQIRVLTGAQILSLSPEIISDFSVIQVQALIRNDNVNVLTQAQISAVDSAAWNALSVSDWKKLTGTQISYIPDTVLENLTPVVKEELNGRLPGSPLRNLSVTDSIPFSAAQLAALNKDVMNVSLPSFMQKTYVYTHPYFTLAFFYSAFDFRAIINIDKRSDILTNMLSTTKGWHFLSSLSLVYGATISAYSASNFDENRSYLDGIYIRNSLTWLALFLQIPTSVLFQARKEYQMQYSVYLSDPTNRNKPPLEAARWALAHTNFSWLSGFGLDWVFRTMFASSSSRVAPMSGPLLVGRGSTTIIGGEFENSLGNGIVYGVPRISQDMQDILDADMATALSSYNKFGILFTDDRNTKWVSFVEKVRSGGVDRIVRKYAQIPANVRANFQNYQDYFGLNAMSSIRTLDGIITPSHDPHGRLAKIMKARHSLVLGDWQDIKNNFVSSNFVYLVANSLMFFNSAHSLYSVTQISDNTTNKNFAYWVNVFGFLGSASLWSSSLLNLFAVDGYARQKWTAGLNTLGWGLNYVSGLLQMTGNILEDKASNKLFQFTMLGVYNVLYFAPISIESKSILITWYAYASSWFADINLANQERDNIAQLRRDLSAQKRTVEVEILDILSTIQRDAIPGINELFRTEQFHRIREILLDNNSEKLNTLFEQQEAARWIYQADGLQKFDQLFMQMRDSVSKAIASRALPIGDTTFEDFLGGITTFNNQGIVDGYNDFYSIHGDTFNTKDVYLTDESHNEVKARLMNAHISTSSFESERNFDQYTAAYESSFFLGDNMARKFLRTSVVNENRITFSDRGVGISYVQVLADDAFVGLNSSPIVLDATAVTKEMFFDVQTANVTINASRTNKSKFKLNVTNSLSSLPLSQQLQLIVDTTNIVGARTDLQEFLGELTIIGVDDNILNINLDHFVDVLVNSQASNTNVVGTLDDQRYTGLLGRNRVRLSGRAASATVKGYGNDVVLGGYGSTLSSILDYVALPGEYPANSGLSVGWYDGGTMQDSDNLNTLNFALTAPALNLLINGSNVAGQATLYDASQNVIDRANFVNFNSIVGSSLNNVIKIQEQSDLKKLFLGEGINQVEVKNTQNLNIEAQGINTQISFREDSGVTKSANYIHATGNNVSVVAYANTVIGGVFEGANDVIDLSRDATSRFDVLTFGWGVHNLSLADNQISAENASLIIMQDLIEGDPNHVSVTNVNDTKVLRTAGNDIVVSLANSLDFNVNYDIDDGLHFESKLGLVKFNFDSLAFDQRQNSNVFLQEGLSNAGNEITVDMAKLVDTIVSMQGGFTMRLQGSSAFNGYDLRAVFDVMRG